ncbi:MAG TPA: L,D-transpeptidase [Pseudonocardia sp.]|nr:L,D-transpeptidase [Pseudonocardia sp.]
MIELLGRHRNRRPSRWGVCVAAAALLGTVPFAGSALADDESEDSGSGSRSSKLAGPPANLVEGTPCTVGTVACVSISDHTAWLVDNGAIAYGPVDVATGGPGQETPVGEHLVQWKDKNHKSSEFKTPDGQPSPMPFSVFFADGGVAFHEGTLERRSAGCVRLEMEDAQHFYTFLQLGDKVQITK